MVSTIEKKKIQNISKKCLKLAKVAGGTEEEARHDSRTDSGKLQRCKRFWQQKQTPTLPDIRHHPPKEPHTRTHTRPVYLSVYHRPCGPDSRSGCWPVSTIWAENSIKDVWMS